MIHDPLADPQPSKRDAQGEPGENRFVMGDTFPVIIDSQRILLRKGEMSPPRWELDFGTIPAQRNFLEGPPFSAIVLTEVRLDLDPPALVADCEGLMLNYWFELNLNGKTLANGPSYEVTNTYAMAESIKPSVGQHSITLKPGDRLTGSIFLGSRTAGECTTPGEPFKASADFRFQISLLGLAADSTAHPEAPAPSSQHDPNSKESTS